MTLRACVLGLCLLAAPAFAPPASAQTADAAIKAEIARLLEMTGTAQIAVQVANTVSGQILEGVRSNPSIPPRAIDVAKEVLQAEFKALMASPVSLIASIGDIYAKYFTIDDIKGLIAFYSSDLGKKLIATLPNLMQESMQAGQQWAAREMPRIQRALEERLQQEGLIKK